MKRLFRHLLMGSVLILAVVSGVLVTKVRYRDRKAALLFTRIALIEYQDKYHHLPNRLFDALSTNDFARIIRINHRFTNVVSNYNGEGGFVYKPDDRYLGLNYFGQSKDIVFIPWGRGGSPTNSK